MYFKAPRTSVVHEHGHRAVTRDKYLIACRIDQRRKARFERNLRPAPDQLDFASILHPLVVTGDIEDIRRIQRRSLANVRSV